MAALVVGIVLANPPKAFDDEWKDDEEFEENEYFYNEEFKSTSTAQNKADSDTVVNPALDCSKCE